MAKTIWCVFVVDGDLYDQPSHDLDRWFSEKPTLSTIIETYKWMEESQAIRLLLGEEIYSNFNVCYSLEEVEEGTPVC